MFQALATAPVAEQILEFTRNLVAGRPAFAGGPKNGPLLPVLRALVEAGTIQAAAIADNAWDDCRPIPAGIAKDLAEACHRLGDAITAAAAAPNAAGWSLPSMSGKEWV
jgi:hypothetical protein